MARIGADKNMTFLSPSHPRLSVKSAVRIPDYSQPTRHTCSLGRSVYYVLACSEVGSECELENEMIGSLARFLKIVFRERPVELKPGARYTATLDLAKVRPGKDKTDVANWLMKMGFTPTSKPDVWKAEERFLSRLPKGGILTKQKL